MQISEHLEKLIDSLSRFPGIGKKTAGRLAWYIVSSDKIFAQQLAENITAASEAFRPCSLCNMLSECDPCPICASNEREQDSICIVQQSADVQIIENMNDYRGLYFVLGHLLSPIDGIGPEEINTPLLISKIDAIQPREVILAIKPSAEGEATMHYLWETLKDRGLQITRLSTGLPFGGDLEYSSSSTLRSAWQRRYGI